MAQEHASGLLIEEHEYVESLIRQTKEALQKYKRDTHFPIVENGDGSLTDSKYGGIPYVVQGESWPICNYKYCKCGYPMEFVVQINLDTLPFNETKFGNGILQVWSCPNMSNSVKARIIRPIDTAGAKIQVPENSFPAKRIVGWKRTDDYPYLEEIEEEDLDEEIWDELDERAAWEYPVGEDKIGGWPSWRQRVEYPRCPICQQEMTTLLLQMAGGSENHKWDEDSTGMGYILQCPNHKNEVGHVYSR